ncbi:conserved hypothetical protein [groundwater metagenome]|uniref:CBS domain-containing protein n=1 Tax=groundwater metagenome TaxID=717931 RepID=A0A098E8K3_9ZZZZ
MEKKYVKDYLHTDIIIVMPKFTVEEVERMVLKYQHVGFPIVENEKLIGFISVLDILFRNPKATIDKFMRTDVIVATPDMEISRAAKIMWRKGISSLPVIDETNKFIGMISNMDILRAEIEHSSYDKVLKIKAIFENLHNCKISIEEEKVNVRDLIPTQNNIEADELQGRMYEIEKNLNEPIVVLRTNNKNFIIDGHHRAVAAAKLNIEEIAAYILISETPVRFGYEKTAKQLNLKSLNDIEITDDGKKLEF